MKTVIDKEVLNDIGKRLTKVFFNNNMMLNNVWYICIKEVNKFDIKYDEADSAWYTLTIQHPDFIGYLPRWTIKRVQYIETLIDEKLDNSRKVALKTKLFLTKEQLIRLCGIVKILA
jgi:uncharacterized membrane protein